MTGARGELVVHEMSDLRIGERRVREEQLPRGEAARVRLRKSRPIAKERDLEAVVASAAVPDPAGHVPPFVAKFRMTAEVARKAQHVAGHDLRIVVGLRAARGEKGKRAGEKLAPFHQSSFTARTTSTLIALRPLDSAVSVESASTRSAAAASVVHGTETAMPQ
jgi:hypothetical protein